MKRAITFLLLLFILVFIPIQNSKAYSTTGTLNNKTLTSDIAIKDGDAVMIGYTDSVSSKTHNDMEIYNINKLDDFIKSTNIGKEDKIRIVEYENNVTGT
ncbi:DUF4362 domain-containing protein [Clostridium frigoris]|uniref:DUF4362 domain-containing protein n=1 Tax=Clostridium frigoris TaxID=205327 RepID=A0ABS6BYY5_9CLOT|nr:DUF4362 domain-containing protein [Clostridium frigoris]MBU3161835.1 DUF4362 domain-containing protein [Clostridium frigoris]